jgi:hypothetical protein
MASVVNRMATASMGVFGFICKMSEGKICNITTPVGLRASSGLGRLAATLAAARDGAMARMQPEPRGVYNSLVLWAIEAQIGNRMKSQSKGGGK